MAAYTTKDIRNIALLGHSDAGKTTLAEALLHAAGATTRLGSVRDGTTVADYEVEERERQHSIDTAVLHLDWKGRHLNLLDAPGRPDFIGAALEALGATDTAAVVVSAASGLGVNTRRLWIEAGKAGLGRIVIVTKMDGENLDPAGLLVELRETFGERLIPANIPVGHGASLEAVVPVLLLPQEIPEAVAGDAAEMHEKFMEAVIEADDRLLERYFGGEEIPPEELATGVAAAIRIGTVVPVLYVSAEKGIGVPELLDFLSLSLSSPEGPVSRSVLAGGEGEEEIERSSDSPLLAQVFKIMTDDYVGKISFLRVFSGELRAESTALNPQTGKTERIKEVFRMQGKEQIPVSALVAGDVGSVTKIEDLSIGDTLCADTEPCRVARPVFPTPMVAVAVQPKSRGDESKIGTSLARLVEEDPTFAQERRADTRQLVISGMSALHLNVMMSRLVRRFHVEVDTRPPRISYRETITARGDAKYRHKKQTGGAGQFAEVHLRIEPRERGAGFEFANEVVGGNIPGQFIPSCEKGIRSVLDAGVIAGYRIVDVKAVVYDGKHHPVDSKDIAFQIAARNAFKEAFRAARPVLLEPIMNVEILIPADKMGDISGDLNSRRGRIMGMDTVAGMQLIRAQVPAAELLSYAADLQSMTGGEGTYTVDFSHYDTVPTHITERIIAQAAKREEG